MNRRELSGILIGVILLAGVLGWLFTAPYLGNEGLARTPGIIIVGTPTLSPDDFTPLNESFQGPLLKKQRGFTSFVN